MFKIGITDHIESPGRDGSGNVLEEVSEMVRLADELGVAYAWFAEHHAYVHYGHLPTPLLLALHLAGQTKRILLGTAIICLNLHHPIDVAEQVAVADLLTGGRMAVGFGSGSTPEESTLFGLAEFSDQQRHARFEQSLETILTSWRDTIVPAPPPDLPGRCWIAVNSAGAATIAGKFNFNVLFSHLRTVEQYREYGAAYKAAGGTRSIAANRPVYVGEDDASAFADAEPALRTLWRRFQREGKIPAQRSEPKSIEELCGHPLNFIVGGPETVRRKFEELHREFPFDVANIEIRWEGLWPEQYRQSLRRLMGEVAVVATMGGQHL